MKISLKNCTKEESPQKPPLGLKKKKKRKKIKTTQGPSVQTHNKSCNVGSTVQRRQGVANVIPDKGE